MLIYALIRCTCDSNLGHLLNLKKQIMYKYIGIDISKQTFDVAYQKQEKWQLFQLSNTLNPYLRT